MLLFYSQEMYKISKIVSEYDQKIPQSQTAYKLGSYYVHTKLLYLFKKILLNVFYVLFSTSILINDIVEHAHKTNFRR